jgi:WD40 repeat protein/serine/threonine protein kinase
MANEPIDEEAVFNSARSRSSPEERLAYLQEACGEDPAALQRILDLLRVYDQEKSFLESPVVVLGATVGAPVAEKPGTVIGPYKLLEQIGEGGFGVVFMAEQTQPVRRKVALKVLKPGMDTRQVVARFEAERQALALMDHPHIAKVFDGGATPSGRPYFVMELVKGMPITDFCDQNQLTPRQRLELFVPVCQAVQHAHQKGLIHRDLKSSNLLVVMHDMTPVPKVIDFGVAKATGQELTDKTLFTGFTQMVGTPLYMSPEQAGQSGLDIDTRSDINSLGVLLYELLTGTTPFAKERFQQAAYDEIRRIIREEEPPKPSTRLTNSGEALASISAQRHMEPAKRMKLVRGELDWIVMKCLEKDRNRRYETANGFALDIQRYLADEPVLACPPSAWYRFRKFARRNKAALFAASVLTLAVLLAVVGLATGMVLAVGQRDVAAAARDREAEARKIAEDLKQAAEDQREAAEKLEKIALEQKALAEKREQTIRRYLYTAHMNLAQQAVALPDPAQAVRMLKVHQPEPGQEDLRSFEWYYWWRQCHRNLLRTLNRHAADVMSVAFSPDGQTLASVSVDRTVRFWDVASGLERVNLTGHTDRIYCVAFSPDGKTLASGGRDGTVKLWDVATSKARATLEGHKHWVRSVAFSPDGRTLASASPDTSIKLWDVATGKLKNTLNGHQAQLSLAFSPDGKSLAAGSRETLAMGGGTLRLWDLDTGKTRDIFTATANAAYPASVAFSPDGKTVAAAICNLDGEGVLKLWEASTGKLKANLKGHRPGVNALAFSPDGKALASGGEDRTVKVWDVARGETTATFLGHGGFVYAVAFSPDCKTLASASMDRTVKLWDVAAVEPKTLLRGHAKPVGAVAFSPDGRTVASAGQDEVVKLWDVASGDLKTTIKGHKDIVTWVAFSPDGKTMASASLDGTVKLWDTTTAKLKLTLAGRGVLGSRVYTSPVAFSPDSKTVATTSPDYTIKLWDADTGQLKSTLKGHASIVLSLAFSPDGKTLASTGSWDHTARLWDVSTGTVKAILTADEIEGWAFYVAAFSRDGKTLATGATPPT